MNAMNTPQHHPPEQPIAHCAVCAKKIHAGEDHVKVEYHGECFRVCCPSCEQKFRASPQRYTVR